MIVCLCHRISDRDIEREAHSGCAHFDELQDCTRVATACGACADCAQDVFSRACHGHRQALPAGTRPIFVAA